MSSRTIQVVVITALTAGTLAAQSHRQLTFNVGPHANLSVNNPFGSIAVHPSPNSTVVINAVLSSDKVEIDNTQTGNRVDIQSHLLAGADATSGRVDYDVLVPADASITLHSSTGPLSAERLHGDVTMEGASATVTGRDLSGDHVHIRTLNGPITLNNIKEGHVEVDSLSGDVTMVGVTGPFVQVGSTSGKISYTGDFGSSGEYRLTSHSGDISAFIPEWTSADVVARTTKGEVHDDIPLQPKNHTWFPIQQGRAFAGTMGRAAVSSTVVLRSFSGKILLKKRPEK